MTNINIALSATSGVRTRKVRVGLRDSNEFDGRSVEAIVTVDLREVRRGRVR